MMAVPTTLLSASLFLMWCFGGFLGYRVGHAAGHRKGLERGRKDVQAWRGPNPQ